MNTNSVAPFYVYYEIQTAKFVLKGTQSEKEESFQKMQGIFNALVTSSQDLYPKIHVVAGEQKILCGYPTEETFKAAFPKAKNHINIQGLLFSSNDKALVAVATPTDVYRRQLDLIWEQKGEKKKRDYTDFREEMEVFYKKNLIAVRPLVNISSCKTTRDLICHFLNHYPGFGVGDSHEELSSLHFFITHMPLFKKYKVTTFFWEGYPEHIEKAVQKYFSPSYPINKFPKKLLGEIKFQQGRLSAILKHRIFAKRFEDGSFSSKFNSHVQTLFLTFFQSLKKHGIQLKSIETRELCQGGDSVNTDKFNKKDPEESNNPSGAKWRIKPMNYCAQNIINTFVQKNPGEKFMYWDGYWHNSFYGEIPVPGISDMISCPWVTFFDGDANEETLVGGGTEQGKEIIRKQVYSRDGHQAYTISPDAVVVLCPDQSKTGKILHN